MNAVWFKRDLRVYDNPALHHAMTASLNGEPTIGVFCLSEWEWDKHQVSPAQRSLIVKHLRTLAASLNHLNVPFVVLKTSTFENTANSLEELVISNGITHVYFNRQYEVNESTLETQIQNKLIAQGVQCSGFDDQCVVAPGQITNKQGECFKVYTAFKRSYFERFYDLARPIASLPQSQTLPNLQTDLKALDAIEAGLPEHSNRDASWPIGEEAAHQILNDFVDDKARHYQENRDYPNLAATSGLSPYLAIGVLTTRQCVQVALNANNGQLDAGNPGLESWINELIWRDFYRHLMFFYPKLSKHKAFKDETDQLPWQHDERAFKQWCDGQTGFPIVDAAMRQLNQTGWMHNRLRMIVAMFLTKDLFIDWRWGEAYFMSKLVDGDLASNNGGWQWSASTGVDAAPYFRIFNPTRQSERFDPDGDFIRQYVPELASLNAKSIHNPSSQQRHNLGYAYPMVDHKTATQRTKAWFKGESVHEQELMPMTPPKSYELPL